MQRGAFIALWVLLFFLHAACAAFLVASALLHWYLDRPIMSYFADLLAPLEYRHLRLFGTLLGIMGGVHALEWLRLVAISIRARRLAIPSAESIDILFRLVNRYVVVPSRRFVRMRVAQVEAQNKSNRSHRRFSSRQLLSSASELFSIHSSRFESVFIFREAAVIMAQIYQCNISSSRIAHPWINHLSAALLAVNCISVAILYPRLRQNPKISRSVSDGYSAARKSSHVFTRLLCHVLDGIITFALSVVLPTATFMPYLPEYDAEAMNFSDVVLYGEIEFPNLVRESQAVFAWSWIGGFYKLIPHASLYICLLVIASVMRENNQSALKTTSVAALRIHVGAEKTPGTVVVSNHTAFSKTETPNGISSFDQSWGSQAVMSPSVRLMQKVTPPSFMAIAIAIMVIHTRAMLINVAGRSWIKSTAANSSISKMCAQPVYSWFSSGSSCSVIKYNCYRQGVDTSPPPDVFDALDPSVVSSVVFMHCSGLIVPSSIQRFKNLLAFEIFNSTLVQWGTEAALTNDFHPNIVYLAMALVNMTELPPGVLQAPLPRQLHDIEISRTNLTTLPPSLPDVWDRIEILFLEHSQLTEVSRELLALPSVSTLSLVGNEITKFPDDLSDFLPAYFYFVIRLSQNPLTLLPETLPPDVSFGFLGLEYTNVSVLPDWVFEQVYIKLLLYGTPACSALTENSAIEAGCAIRSQYINGFYPFAFVSSRREL